MDIFVINNRTKFNVVKKLFESKIDNAVKIEIDVYRKPCSTVRAIPSDSHHDMKHKTSAFYAMAHFMMNLPFPVL